MTAGTANHDLVGSWKLVDWTVRMNGGRETRPFGGRAMGIITYTDEGRMTATLMKADRPTIGTRSFNEATAMERASAAAGYLSYAGTYEIIGDEVHWKDAAAAISPRRDLLIAGNWSESVDGRRFTTTNPATGSVITEVAEADADDADVAVAAARSAFDDGSWSRRSPRERGDRRDHINRGAAD